MTGRYRFYVDEPQDWRSRLSAETAYAVAWYEVEREPGPDRRAADALYWQMVLGRTCLNDAGLWGGLCAHLRSVSRGQG